MCRIIKRSLLSAMLVLTLPVACQAQPLTECCIVEFGRNAVFPNQSFRIKLDHLRRSDNPSNIAETNSYASSDFLADNKQKIHGCYSVPPALIESISWQLLYASTLLVDYELILNTKHTPVSSTPYPGLPVEVFVAVSWLLKNYWNSDSPLFTLTEQQEVGQDHPSAAITTMLGSGHKQPHQPSESSSQKAPGTSTHCIGSFTGSLSTNYGDDNSGPQRHLHTLGLNCFVYPCRGVCKLRKSSDNTAPSEWSLNFVESSTGHTGALHDQSSCPHLANGQCFSCIVHADTVNATLMMSAGTTYTTNLAEPLNDDALMLWNLPFNADDLMTTGRPLDLGGSLKEVGIPVTHSKTQQNATESSRLAQSEPYLSRTVTTQAQPNNKNIYDKKHIICNITLVGKDGQQQPCGRAFSNAQSLSCHKSKYHTGKKTCNVTVVGKDDQQRPCGIVFRNACALGNHKRSFHRRQQKCNRTVIGEDGQQRPCGTVCKNLKGLTDHKRRYHSGQQTCNVTVIGKDGQQQSCGRVYKNIEVLSVHKSSCHSGQRTCDVTVTGEDGQGRPCGMVCKNVNALWEHKRKEHTGQQTCDITLVWENGQPRPCGTIWKCARALTDHKRRAHSGQRTCAITVVGKDNQPRPCGKICKSARTLTDHKRKAHTWQQACDVTLVGKDGLQQQCGKFCKDAQALSNHKSKVHSGQQTCAITLVGKDGQQRPCQKVCKNIQALEDHKRRHRKRKLVDREQYDDKEPQ
ncbi:MULTISPECIES: hypothetical protein [unclassified Endozoicomonas]|uniref:hypothetical protein n=1 Tax=unclassified Endozoicomonas TaxID=2644528 RepID=UPI0021499911|nr:MULTISPECIES: hypothetical protein [unclassified Endozoicomonas]